MTRKLMAHGRLAAWFMLCAALLVWTWTVNYLLFALAVGVLYAATLAVAGMRPHGARTGYQRSRIWWTQ